MKKIKAMKGKLIYPKAHFRDDQVQAISGRGPTHEDPNQLPGGYRRRGLKGLHLSVDGSRKATCIHTNPVEVRPQQAI